MRRQLFRIVAAAAAGSAITIAAYATANAADETPAYKDTAVASEVDGKYFTAEGTPTFKVSEDGTVDWYTYSGFRRYHSACHVCHGPDGLGSTYAPPLSDAVMNMDYYEFMDVVVNGLEDVNTAQTLVMPSFGLNKNVMCYLDDIYVYLRGRGAGEVPRGRPHKHAPKPEGFTKAEDACMG